MVALFPAPQKYNVRYQLERYRWGGQNKKRSSALLAADDFSCIKLMNDKISHHCNAFMDLSTLNG